MAKKIDEIYAEFVLKMDKKGFSFLDKKLGEIDKKVAKIESRIMKSKAGKKISLMTGRLKELGRVDLSNLDKLSKVKISTIKTSSTPTVKKSKIIRNLPLVMPQVRNLPAIPQMQSTKKLEKINNQFKVLSKNMDNVKKKSQKLSLGFNGEVTNLNRINTGLKKIDDTVKKVTRSFSNLGEKIQSSKKNLFALGAGAGLALAVLTSGISASVNEFATFQDQMLRVKALTGATSKEYSKLSEQSKNLGATTAFTAQEVASAQGNLAQAGQKVNEIIASTPAILTLASAGQLQLAKSADIVGSSLGQFSLDATEASRVADVLAKTANTSQSDVAFLGSAVNNVGVNAKEMGLSFEQTLGALGSISSGFSDGGAAGTGLNATLRDLKKNSDKLGFSITNQNGEYLELSNIVGKLTDKTKDMTQAEKANYLSKVFGDEALKTTNLLMEKGEEGLKNYTKELMKSEGFSKTVAATLERGLGGSLRSLNSSVSGLAVEIGEQLTPVFQPLVDVMSSTINVVTKFIASTDAAIPIITILAGALIGALIPALYLSATALWSLVAPALVIAAPFIAWGVAIGAVVGVIVWAYKKFETFRNIIDLLGESIKFLLSLTLTSTWLKGFEKIKSFFGGDNNIEMNGEKNLDVISNNTAEGTNQDRRQREANNSTNNYNRSNSTSITNNNTIINNVRDNKSLEDRQREDLSYNNRRFSY